MSSSNELENEDLSNVPLVRMEDVQPCRQGEIIESCVIYDVDDYDNECILISENDEYSNVGSNVSIRAEEVEIETESEVIIPDSTDAEVQEISLSAVNVKTEEPLDESREKMKIIGLKPSKPDWPLLEILPGGVIKYADENIIEEDKHKKGGTEIFACAKCSQKFTHLFCLVKHIRWHTEQAKKAKANAGKFRVKKKYVCLHSNKAMPTLQIRRVRKS